MKNVKTQKYRQLTDLVSVGSATLKDFNILGIKTVKSLARQDATKLYLQICKVTRKQHDICVLDVFTATIAQARNPLLSLEKCQWWYWSKLRKENNGKKD